MSAFQITGGVPLYGSIRLGGAKNASYKLMIGALLGSEESRLLNFSDISDVGATSEIIESLGGQVQKRGERTLFIDPKELKNWVIADKYGPKSRSASMFIPALLHRFNKVVVPTPGGDKIGLRPLERHWDGLKAMGAKIDQTSSHIEARAEKLIGTSYRFEKNTHTGTETLIMAAVLAQGITILENAALEPEIDDLITFLNNMGARIRRRYHRVIEIEGVKKLTGSIHKIMPDRNEAVSYACAAVSTKGDIIVENARREHLEAFLDKLDEIGGGYEVGSYGIRFFHKGDLRSTDITTEPYPGFMTDWQPLWAVLLTQAKGKSIIHEAVFPSRFQYAQQLSQMDAKINFFNPEVKNPEKFYNFNLEENSQAYRAIAIEGPSKLKPGNFEVYDLRAGATLVLAALISEGITVLSNIELIDRGYENLDGRLKSMGAKIKRV